MAHKIKILSDNDDEISPEIAAFLEKLQMESLAADCQADLHELLTPENKKQTYEIGIAIGIRWVLDSYNKLGYITESNEVLPTQPQFEFALVIEFTDNSALFIEINRQQDLCTNIGYTEAIDISKLH